MSFANQMQPPLPVYLDRQHGLHHSDVKRACGYPDSACLQQLFEAQAARTPEAVAVLFGEEQLTYRELDLRANRLATCLRQLGVGPDVMVGLCVHRSLAMMEGLLAILKAGGGYVPLDPTYPPDRLQFMLEDSKAAVVVTQSSLGHIFPPGIQRRIYLDAPLPQATLADIQSPALQTTGSSLAYLMYTSGSTGRPKGIAMIHRALVNLIDWQSRHYPLPVGARTLQFTSLSFDVSFQEIFSTWCTGGTLVLVPAQLRLAPAALWTYIVEQKIARLYLPFVALRQLSDAAVQADLVATHLRQVITAGEQLQITPSLRELFFRHPRATLHNHYGPTETHVVTAHLLVGDPREWSALPPIGRPIQHTRIHLLDDQLAPVPLGSPGELYVGGIALARGYHERPDITAARFIPDPFSREPGARLYRTGDIAKLRSDGEIEFLGRTDHQVKIRGHRIELAEIEMVLAAHPQVQGAVVIAREQPNGGKNLVAYVVWRKAEALEWGATRRFLNEKLPAYMVPSALVSLAAFPLTPSGKVDRNALPVPTVQNVAKDAVLFPPQSESECRVAEIFRHLLQCPEIGLDDDFFECGGDSLLAVELVAEINRTLAAHVDVLLMLQNPTVRALARCVDLQEASRPSARLVKIRAGEGVPCYFINTGLEFFEIARRLSGPEPVYISDVLWRTKDLRVAAAGRLSELPTLSELAERHTQLILAGGMPGPCHLAGYSFGGSLAFEVAHQLSAAGVPVENVFLFDANMGLPRWRRTIYWCRRQGRRLLRVARAPGKLRPDVLWRPKLAGRDPATSQISVASEYVSWESAPWDAIELIWRQALRAYRLRPLRSRGILFRAEESIYGEKLNYDGCLGWSKLFIGGLEVADVPGDHSTMWKDPHRQVLSRRFEAALAKARNRFPASPLVREIDVNRR